MMMRFSATPWHKTFTLQKSKKSTKISYKKFIKLNTESEDVEEDERITFLTMWLCKNFFVMV